MPDKMLLISCCTNAGSGVPGVDSDASRTLLYLRSHKTHTGRVVYRRVIGIEANPRRARLAEGRNELAVRHLHRVPALRGPEHRRVLLRIGVTLRPVEGL